MTQEQFDQLWRLIANGFANQDARFVSLETRTTRLVTQVETMAAAMVTKEDLANAIDSVVVQMVTHEQLGLAIAGLEERLRADFLTVGEAN